MKILKNAKQRNFLVDKAYYCEHQLRVMQTKGIVDTIENDVDRESKPNYRVFACDCKDVKVICEDGYYNTVVITKDGEKIYIVL